MLTSSEMSQQSIRPTAVAGSWYSNRPDVLAREVDEYLASAVGTGAPGGGEILGLIAPHAGLMYSGAVAAYAYRAVAGGQVDVAILIGPSHYVGFDGVSIWPRGAYESPLGAVPVSDVHAAAIRRATATVHEYPPAHGREHSLEMQLPFIKRVLPDVPIVPLVMGSQDRATIFGLADGLVAALRGVRALLVASTDLSHYFPAARAKVLDGRVAACVRRFDTDGLLAEFEAYPEHERGRFVACGGGPMIAVMRTVRALGASEARVLKCADSGDVSGDTGAVVGYMAAAFGTFSAGAERSGE